MLTRWKSFCAEGGYKKSIHLDSATLVTPKPNKDNR